EIVSGEREAELIYRGAAGSGRQLVIDIGGGSTELALGSGDHIHQLASVSIGCITQLEHFPGGALSAAHFERAHAAACARLRADWRGTAPRGWPRWAAPARCGRWRTCCSAKAGATAASTAPGCCG